MILIGRLLAPRRAVGYRKMRVGGPDDGAYVMLDRFDGIEVAFSLGVGPNVDWDYAIAGRGIAVHQFDHTVPGPPRRHAGFHFHKRRIDAEASAETENLASLLSGFGASKADANLLKVDIEGAEWALFADADGDSLTRFPQILCEFHGVSEVQDEAHYRLMMRALTRLHKDFAVVHLHANNNGGQVGLGDQSLPYCLEVTFANRRLFDFVDETETFPTILDRPNDPGQPDIYLGHFAFDAPDTDVAGLEALADRSAAAAGFDGDRYLAANPDIARAGLDPWAHWRLSGWREGRPLSIDELDFDRHAYLAANPDVAAAGFDALTHWRHFGRREGRPLTRAGTVILPP